MDEAAIAGPVVHVYGPGIDIKIRVEDELDREIIEIALRMAKQRRWFPDKLESKG